MMTINRYKNKIYKKYKINFKIVLTKCWISGILKTTKEQRNKKKRNCRPSIS